LSGSGLTRGGVRACARSDAFQQCKKIVDTPFPYPYAQAVLCMLCIYTVFAPLLVCEIVNSPYLAVGISMIAVSAYATMNEVCAAAAAACSLNRRPRGHDTAVHAPLT
jgi:predicted membrane chloride channel (bestrophin family)